MNTVQPSGVVYPLTWLDVIQNCQTLAEMKVVAAVWGYDGVIGIDCEELSFTELLHRTGLSKRTLTEGLKKALESGYISHENTKSKPVYLPLTKSKPHDHDIMINKDIMLTTESIREEHDHEVYFLKRQAIREILSLEFAMHRSNKVADDICFSPKYTLENLENQLRYARWENKRGKASMASRPVRNPAGNLVTRFRTNEAAPAGFNLVKALVEDEGWALNDLYWAVYNGDFDMPSIKETIEYSYWLYETHEAEQEGEVIDEA